MQFSKPSPIFLILCFNRSTTLSTISLTFFAPSMIACPVLLAAVLIAVSTLAAVSLMASTVFAAASFTAFSALVTAVEILLAVSFIHDEIPRDSLAVAGAVTDHLQSQAFREHLEGLLTVSLPSLAQTQSSFLGH